MKYPPSHYFNRDGANTPVAAYESMLDLFTLVSFILILAAFVFVARSAGQDQNWSSIVAQVAERRSGASRTLPRDVLLIVAHRKDSIDKLTLMDGVTGDVNHLDVTVESIDRVLNSFSPTFTRAGKINLGVYDSNERVNPGILLAVQRWLAGHQYHYRLYFAGIQ